MSEIDHEYTPDMICPNCGHIHREAWDLDDDSGEVECSAECGATFTYERFHLVQYTTKLKP